MIDNFAKTLTRNAVTQTENNLSGSEELTWGSDSEITGAFFRRDDTWNLKKEAYFESADAILMVKSSVTLNKNDKITYDNIVYLVDHVITRTLNGTTFYKTATLFQFQD